MGTQLSIGAKQNSGRENLKRSSCKDKQGTVPRSFNGSRKC